MRVDLALGATTKSRTLYIATLTALVVGLVCGSPVLIVFAAATAIPLLRAGRYGGPGSLTVVCDVPRGDLVEGEPVEVTITLTFNEAGEFFSAVVHPNDWLAVQPGTASAAASDTTSMTWTSVLTPARWGPSRAPIVTVYVVSGRGLHEAQAEFRLPIDIVALPQPAPMAAVTAALARAGRAGNHPSRLAGAGVEFHGIRPYQPGDLPRHIHWPASTRRGELYVTERVAESAIDTVVVIDAFAESGPSGRSTLDHSVRGAAGIARSMLDSGDRVGLAMLGGVLGWLPPATSTRQWYRIVTTALSVRIQETFVTPDITRIPPVALPSGALVVVLTPLLDDRAISVLGDLRRRRFGVFVIDVLQPPQQAKRRTDAQVLADRLWRLGRASTHARLTSIGCRVIEWTGDAHIALPAVGRAG